MSAFTEATIIVEAGQTSGTLIQARAALHHGRKPVRPRQLLPQSRPDVAGVWRRRARFGSPEYDDNSRE